MNARAYAHALARLGDSVSAEKAVSGLVEALKAKGRLKMLPQILRELKSAEGMKLGTNALVEVSRESEASAALKAAKAEGIDAKDVVVTPSLLKGWRARGNGILIDRSGKKNLIDLYRKITN